MIHETVQTTSNNKSKHSNIALSHEESHMTVLVLNCEDRSAATDEAITTAVRTFYQELYGEGITVDLLPSGFDHSKVRVTVPNDVFILQWTFVPSIEI